MGMEIFDSVCGEDVVEVGGSYFHEEYETGVVAMSAAKKKKKKKKPKRKEEGR